LELLDNNIGPKGANALGASLAFGNNISLLTLKLDYNQSMGSEGKISPAFIISLDYPLCVRS
jgi:hypothetical protein